MSRQETTVLDLLERIAVALESPGRPTTNERDKVPVLYSLLTLSQKAAKDGYYAAAIEHVCDAIGRTFRLQLELDDRLRKLEYPKG